MRFANRKILLTLHQVVSLGFQWRPEKRERAHQKLNVSPFNYCAVYQAVRKCLSLLIADHRCITPSAEQINIYSEITDMNNRSLPGVIAKGSGSYPLCLKSVVDSVFIQ